MKLITPALVFDADTLAGNVRFYREFAVAADATLLYSLKACPLAGVLAEIAPGIGGLSVSSLFELQLAWTQAPDLPRFYFSAALTAADLPEITRSCQYLSLNSLSVTDLAASEYAQVNLGLRLNPQISLLDEPRYDPCRVDSKLGVPLDQLEKLLARDARLGRKIRGIHFHNNHGATDFQSWRNTLEHVVNNLPPALAAQLRWLNIGGGYLAQAHPAADALAKYLRALRAARGWEILLEPGRGIAGNAATLHTRVVDIIERADHQIAVVDTSVNHLPQVFEYQQVPLILEAKPQAAYRYRIAGGTCLAGDEFGVHHFAAPLQRGSLLRIADAGAYTLAKAHFFNGHNLPTVYLQRGAELSLLKEYDYADFARLYTR